MRYIPVIIALLQAIVSSQVVYPQPSGLPVQWIQEGFWFSCKDNSEILAQNCNPTDEKFIECYQIPDQGLCSNQITSSSNELYSFMDFKFKNSSSFILEINGKQQNGIQNLISNNTKNVMKLINPQVPFKIQINNAGGDDLFLLQGTIQTQDLSQNCQKQDENFLCQQCADSYFFYSGQCIPRLCITQLSNLASNGMSQRLTYKNGVVSQEFIINNILNLGDCIVPRLYLIKNLDDPQMTYIFPKSYLSRPDDRSAVLNLPIADFSKFPCDKLETSTDYVLQCYVSFAATVQGLTQYQYITIVRVSINKQISSKVTYSDQGIAIPDKCCDSLQVNVLNEAKILNILTSGPNKYIVASQILRDPQYKTRSIKFVSASLSFANGNTYNLKFVNSTIDTNSMTVTYYLLVDPQADITKLNPTIQIISQLATTGRILYSPISNIQPNYVLSTTMKLYSEDIDSQIGITDKSSNSEQNQRMKYANNAKRDETGLYDLLIVVICLFCVYVGYVTYKNYNKDRQRQRQFYSNEQNIIVSNDQLD